MKGTITPRSALRRPANKFPSVSRDSPSMIMETDGDVIDDDAVDFGKINNLLGAQIQFNMMSQGLGNQKNDGLFVRDNSAMHKVLGDGRNQSKVVTAYNKASHNQIALKITPKQNFTVYEIE